MLDNSNHPEPEPTQDSPKNHTFLITALGAGLVVALGSDAYLFMQSRSMQQDIANVEAGANTQISKLSETTSARMDEQQKHFSDDVVQRVKDISDSTSAAIRRARAEADKKASELSSEIADTHTELASNANEINALKDTTNSKFTEVSGDVDQVKANVEGVKTSAAATQTELEGTNTELKRVVGDMGVMSGLIATNSKDLATLRALGERNYFEFDLTKNGPHKVGDITLTLRKSDIKRNRYTIDIFADDKHVEKRDKTINEPVQLYVGGGTQPYEIVINQVKKDAVSGYLATPKMKLARR